MAFSPSCHPSSDGGGGQRGRNVTDLTGRFAALAGAARAAKRPRGQMESCKNKQKLKKKNILRRKTGAREPKGAKGGGEVLRTLGI